MIRLLLRFTFLLVLLFAGACGSDPSSPMDNPPISPAAAGSNYLPGEVLLRLRTDSTAARAATGREEDLLAGAKVAERIRLGGYRLTTTKATKSAENNTPAFEILRLQLPAGMSVEAAIEQLATRDEVRYAEPNYRVRRAVVPNDPFFAKQWGLKNLGQTLSGDWGTIVGTPGVDIKAPDAWDTHSGDGSVIVATIDTGIEYDHPDLANNIWINQGESGLDVAGNNKRTNGIDDDANGYVDDWHGWNFAATPNNNDPKDDDRDLDLIHPLGHGSHVAGIIGAVGDNNEGVSGINWKVQLMPVKFLSYDGDGDIAKVANAINYAVNNGARVINASYEYGGASQAEFDAIAAAGAAEVLFVAAAGNGNDNHIGYNLDTGSKVYPAAHNLNNIISVAAIDSRDNKASFSNYGPTSVDLGAPGVNIYSTVRRARTGIDGEVGYDYMSGTSMAAPMVSGSAALILSKHPELTATDVRNLLFNTVDITDGMRGKVVTGGRLNLGRAMTANINLPPPAPPTGLVGESQVGGAALSWQSQSDNESFIVERTISGQPFIPLVRLDANVTTYSDSSASAGSVVQYKIKAVAGFHSSAYSNEVEVSIPFLLAPPTDLRYSSDSLGIHLKWTDSSPDAKEFKLERRPENATIFSEIASLPFNSPPEYTDIYVTAGARYVYKVRSYSTTLGYSDYSNEILAQMVNSSGSGSSNCFIATAAFGTPLAPQVDLLRVFRDRILLTNGPGRLFVELYYRTSPPLANFIADHEMLRAGVRTLLRPLIWFAGIVTSDAEAMGLFQTQPPEVTESADVVAGEMLVCFRPELTEAATTKILQLEKAERLEQIDSPQGTLLRVKLAAGVTTTAAQQNFSAYKEVIYAEPNRRVRIRRP